MRVTSTVNSVLGLPVVVVRYKSPFLLLDFAVTTFSLSLSVDGVGSVDIDMFALVNVTSVESSPPSPPSTPPGSLQIDNFTGYTT